LLTKANYDTGNHPKADTLVVYNIKDDCIHIHSYHSTCYL